MKIQYYRKVWFVLGLGWVSIYMIRIGMSPLLLTIKEEMGLTYTQTGQMAMAVFIAYVAMQLLSGHLGDRWGRKLIMVVGAFGWTAMSFLTGFSRSFAYLFTLRLLTGLTQGTYFGNDRPIVTYYTPSGKWGMGQAVTMTGMCVGMVLGFILAGAIAEMIDWRAVFFIFSMSGLVVGLLLMRTIKEPPPERVEGAETRRGGYRAVFRSTDLWMAYLTSLAGMYGYWMLLIWGPAMFEEIGVQELVKGSTYASLVGIMGIPGLLAAGYLSDRVAGKGLGRKWFISIQLIIGAALFMLMGGALSYGWAPVYLALLVLLAGFFIFGLYAPLYAMIGSMAPQRILGTTFGFTNFVSFLASIISPWHTGYVKDVTGSFAGACQQSGIILLAGAVLILFINPAFRWKPEKMLTI